MKSSSAVQDQVTQNPAHKLFVKPLRLHFDKYKTQRYGFACACLTQKTFCHTSLECCRKQNTASCECCAGLPCFGGVSENELVKIDDSSPKCGSIYESGIAVAVRSFTLARKIFNSPLIIFCPAQRRHKGDIVKIHKIQNSTATSDEDESLLDSQHFIATGSVPSRRSLKIREQM